MTELIGILYKYLRHWQGRDYTAQTQHLGNKNLNKLSYERDSAVLLTFCEGTLQLEMCFPWVGEKHSSVT